MTEVKQISVATLNFSGINTNPFQYNDGSPLFEDLNKNFLHIKSIEFPNTKKWAGASLDKRFKNNRFTILFGDEMIQNIGEKLPSKAQFHQSWRFFYGQAVSNNKIDYNATPEEVDDVQNMDFTFYRTVVMAVYGYKTLEQYEAKSSEQSSEKLLGFLKLKRDSPPFQLKEKKNLVLKYQHGVDLMILQQAGSVQWQQQQGYTNFQHHDSVIIYKTDVFGVVDEKQTKKWQHLLDINDDTAAVFTKNGYLLISSHFKSSAPFFYEQEAQLFKVLNYVIDYYSLKPYKIIVGVDANHRIENVKINHSHYIVPTLPSESSSIKRRSYIQAQLHKADQAVDELKDHIISTQQIKEYSLELIDGTKSKKELLPNDRHPYDHYIVKAKLII